MMRTQRAGRKAIGIGAAVLATLCVAGTTVLSVSAASGGLIGKELAKEKALGQAGVGADEVTRYRIELDQDDGVSYYEVKFTHGTTRYDVDVNAADGSVMGMSKKMRRPAGSAPATGTLGAEAAKEKALAYADVAAADALFTKTKLDRDDGVQRYEIEFSDADRKYEVELLASDGTVLEFSWKGLSARKASAASGTTITAEAAKEIALGHAGVSVGDATFLKVKLDRDDGVLEYDIEFVAGGKEYEYELSAATGAVLGYDVEWADR